MRKDSFAAGPLVFAQSVKKHGGYDATRTIRDQIQAASSVPGLKGLEWIAPAHVTLENAKEVKSCLEVVGLEPIAVKPYLWTEPRWSGFSGRS